MIDTDRDWNELVGIGIVWAGIIGMVASAIIPIYAYRQVIIGGFGTMFGDIIGTAMDWPDGTASFVFFAGIIIFFIGVLIVEEG